MGEFVRSRADERYTHPSVVSVVNQRHIRSREVSYPSLSVFDRRHIRSRRGILSTRVRYPGSMRDFDALSFLKTPASTHSLLKFSACATDICSSKNHRSLANGSPNCYALQVGLKPLQEKNPGVLMFHITGFHEHKGGNSQPRVY